MPVISCRTHCEAIRNRISTGDPLDIGRLHKAFFRDNDHTNSFICLNGFSISRLTSETESVWFSSQYLTWFPNKLLVTSEPPSDKKDTAGEKEQETKEADDERRYAML